jgi:short-subunit dehydrogenase
MKIAITGHSKGIGKALYDNLSQDHVVEGYSRSNGYDIATDIDKIIFNAIDCDVFVNNAYKGIQQVDILYKLYNHWKNHKSKTIVNINSISKYPGLSGNMTGYSAHKAALWHAASQIMFKDPTRRCRIININPGYVNTSMTNHMPDIEGKSITADECADTIAWAINQPQHIEIGELTVYRTFI